MPNHTAALLAAGWAHGERWTLTGAGAAVVAARVRCPWCGATRVASPDTTVCPHDDPTCTTSAPGAEERTHGR